MYQFLPKIQKFYSDLFSTVFGSFFYEKLRLSPNHLSFFGFGLSLLSAFFIFQEKIWLALVFLAASLLFDGLDGSIARKYDLVSPLGKKLELFFDRIAELSLLGSLFATGFIGFYLFLFSWVLIWGMSFLAIYTKIDFGGKRITLFLGPFFSFTFSCYLIIAIQLLSISVSVFKIFKKYVRGK